MKLTFLIGSLFCTMWSFAAGNPAFILKLTDKGISIQSPDKTLKIFSVIIENQSLTDQVAKLVVGDDVVKYVRLNSGRSETVEIENKTAKTIFFVPVSPSFQEVELKFGKKQYEIPAQR